jgi:catechol 2,3-dioxygenase-like lactoylglutathione lyase family enzyme
MTLRLATVVLDVRDLQRATAFWRDALGYAVANEGDAWVKLTDPRGAGAAVGLQPRADAKGDVNRVHRTWPPRTCRARWRGWRRWARRARRGRTTRPARTGS